MFRLLVSFVFLNCCMCVCVLLLVFYVLCSSVIVVFVFLVCRLFFHLVFLVVFSVSRFVLCCWWSLFCCLLILCCLCLLCFVCVPFVFLNCVLCLSVCFLLFFVFCVSVFLEIIWKHGRNGFTTIFDPGAFKRPTGSTIFVKPLGPCLEPFGARPKWFHENI